MKGSAYSATISVSNKTERPRIVWVEPIPEDYTLLPGESLEIVVGDQLQQPWFELVEWTHASQIYVAGISIDIDMWKASVHVLQKGNRLQPGHQRAKGEEAGLKY